MHPNEVKTLLGVIEKEGKEKELQKALNAPPNMPAIAAPHPLRLKNIQPNVQMDTLDKVENAIVPYEMQQQNELMGTEPQFDILIMLSGLDDDTFDNQMVLAATQVEQQHVTKTAIMKKNHGNPFPNQTFQNCTFGNIGTLNIHVHKH